MQNRTWLFLPLFALPIWGCSKATPTSDEPTTSSPTEPRATSGFESSADGWTITGDAQADHVEPDYSGQGGNPDGLISAVDDVTGGVWYFQAPAKYLGDASADYGQFLDFDLKTSDVSNPFDSFDVVLEGAGLTLGFDTPTNPKADAWSSYSISLDENAGWRVATVVSEDAFKGFSSLPLASQAQLKSTLGNVTRLLIRGEYRTGSDTGYLDNVRFGAGN